MRGWWKVTFSVDLFVRATNKGDAVADARELLEHVMALPRIAFVQAEPYPGGAEPNTLEA